MRLESPFEITRFPFFQNANRNLLRLLIKPGIQEWGTECGECRERGESSLGFQGIY